ncbi:MAG: hypothetical protein EBW14_21570 [Oxalobacteraceae bacterium]|nr:hypothetical protein [Oxalobacteraceae bacterium]
MLASSSGEALVEAFTYLRDEPFVREHIEASESARLWGVVTMVLVVAGYFAKRLVGRVPVLATVSKVVLVAALKDSELKSRSAMVMDGQVGLIKVLGNELFTRYVVPFEISSILFLSAMVGAVVIGKKD